MHKQRPARRRPQLPDQKQVNPLGLQSKRDLTQRNTSHSHHKNVQNKQSGSLHHQRSQKRWEGGLLKPRRQIQYVLPPRTQHHSKFGDHLRRHISHLHYLQALLWKQNGKITAKGLKQSIKQCSGNDGESIC